MTIREVAHCLLTAANNACWAKTVQWSKYYFFPDTFLLLFVQHNVLIKFTSMSHNLHAMIRVEWNACYLYWYPFCCCFGNKSCFLLCCDHFLVFRFWRIRKVNTGMTEKYLLPLITRSMLHSMLIMCVHSSILLSKQCSPGLLPLQNSKLVACNAPSTLSEIICIILRIRTKITKWA